MRAFADPKVKARIADLGGTVVAGSPADFGKLIAEETEKWAKVVKFSGTTRADRNFMKLPRRRFLQLAAGAAALPTASRMATAQGYPSRQITMIVPFAAGGPADTVARVMAERMRGLARPNGGDRECRGRRRQHRGRPDRTRGTRRLHVRHGHFEYAGGEPGLSTPCPTTCRPISSRSRSSPAIRTSSSQRKRTRRITSRSSSPGSRPTRTRRRPGLQGNGSPPHLGAVFFQHASGTHFGFVPYRGGGPAMQDLVAGQIDLMIDAPATVLPQLRANTIKVACPCSQRPARERAHRPDDG